ncbi:KH homology domain-containing protein 4-like isoform X1 [Myxocyprinus asiaticus]|uniref:KH homology domain-containing protein 4-like isoform X1 n=1 Tax=Myxocyprinus asiaticus TaxID=70543 RepID=UPI002221FEAE|nr:KH homology domain-containing protein 4-like isoform X1 [Myxocyprinus asiaticus]
MSSQSPCLSSRWDQAKPRAGILQGVVGSESRAANVAPVLGAAAHSSSSVSTPDVQEPLQGGVEMAAAMAAKINAMLMAKGKLKPLQPLPSKAPSAPAAPVSTDEVIVAEVDINDVPLNCRNLLTKGKTQEEIRLFSGAVVSTKGLYMSDAEKSSSAATVRSLYLHVQGRSQEEVNKAVVRIKELICEDVRRSSDGLQPPVMPTVPVYRHSPAATASLPPNTPTIPAHKPPPPHSGSFVHNKIFVGLDQSNPSFNVNERVEGPSGSYLQHIQSETGARVFLRGKGSGYIEQASRRESFEPLYLYISHPNATGLNAAKKLCESLLQTVRADYARMMLTYPATGSTTVYPPHGYSANNSYSSQSWFSYPSNGYTSTYPPFPTVSGYWNNSSGLTGQSQLTSSPVQYPVCSHHPNTFLKQDEDAASDAADRGSSPSGSPKRLFSEEQQKTQNEMPADVAVNAEGHSCSESTLMPPPAAPVIRKRPAEETSRPLIHTAEENIVKKIKLPEVSSSSSGLVPYGGDSSDEEEERTRFANKNTL